MSTGAPSLSVDLVPPSNAPAHGHSRRGHSRSRWAQPPPFSLVPDNSPPQQPVPTEAVNCDPANEQVLQAPWTSHQHLPSQSTAHHHHHHAPSISSIYSDATNGLDKRASVNGGVGIPGTSLHTADANFELIHEIITGLLIALPWISLSWYHGGCSEACKAPSGDSPNGPVWQKTGILTAITLLVFGCGKLLQIHHQSGSSGNLSSIKYPTLDAKTAKTSLFQVCSIGLPFYAALNIGGFLVAFALLLSTASGLPSLVAGAMHTEVKERYSRKMLTIALLVATMLLSFAGLNQPLNSSPFLGYLALLTAVFVLPPPFPSLRNQGPIPEPGLAAKPSVSGPDIVVTTTDAPLALVSGGILALFTVLFSRAFTLGMSDLIIFFVPASLLALSLMIALPSRYRSSNKVGLAICTGTAALLCFPHTTQDDLIFVYVSRGILSAVSFFAARLDDSHLRLNTHSHTYSHHHHGKSGADASRVTKWLLHRSEPYPLLYSILKEKDSRRIFYFMCLNFAFMLVQLSYGFLTGSLGLLSDSIHMFFDCLALVVGLCAAVMSKWPPNARFPYGYGKVDTLSGFANGIFLMIISVEIIYEAVERLSSGSQMHRIGELLAVSMAGLVVNLVGIFSFEHGHHHGHGHDGHDHSHGNENMHGIFLHILADTLGSVAVVISTVLVHYSGWSGYDPLASCLIAILIFASAVPLVSSTAKSLLLTLPADTEYNVRETLAGVSTLRGVVGYTVPKFWLDDTGTVSSDHAHSHDHGGDGHDSHDHHHHHSHDHHDHDHDHDHAHAHEKKSLGVLGVIHVIASRGADLEDVRQRTVGFLQEKGMDIVVQVERDGDGRCWCGGGNRGS